MLTVTNDTNPLSSLFLSGENRLERKNPKLSDMDSSTSPDTTREIWEGIPRRCKFCHEWFMPNTKNHTFCSEKCGSQFNRPRTKNSWLGKAGICQVCFKEYFRTGWHQKYCSRKCYALAQIDYRRKYREKMKIGMR
jgi:predicted nucleic acid-binding Zn ribbon protein